MYKHRQVCICEGANKPLIFFYVCGSSPCTQVRWVQVRVAFLPAQSLSQATEANLFFLCTLEDSQIWSCKRDIPLQQ